MKIFFSLLLAALLEAGGDALVRKGLQMGSGWLRRMGFFAVGTLVLFLYAAAVNAPGNSFAKLTGMYVVFFFVVAQLIAWYFFHEIPDRRMWIGGALLVLGGLVISSSKG